MNIHEVKIGDTVVWSDTSKKPVKGKVIHRFDPEKYPHLAGHVNIQTLDGKQHPKTVHVSKLKPCTEESTMSNEISELNKSTYSSYMDKSKFSRMKAVGNKSRAKWDSTIPNVFKTVKNSRGESSLALTHTDKGLARMAKHDAIRVKRSRGIKNARSLMKTKNEETIMPNEIRESIHDMLADVIAGNNVEAQQVFNHLIAQRAEVIVGSTKMAVAQTMFNDTVDEDVDADEIVVLSQDEYDALTDEERGEYDAVEIDEDTEDLGEDEGDFITQEDFDALSDEEKAEYDEIELDDVDEDIDEDAELDEETVIAVIDQLEEDYDLSELSEEEVGELVDGILQEYMRGLYRPSLSKKTSAAVRRVNREKEAKLLAGVGKIHLASDKSLKAYDNKTKRDARAAKKDSK